MGSPPGLEEFNQSQGRKPEAAGWGGRRGDERVGVVVVVAERSLDTLLSPNWESTE